MPVLPIFTTTSSLMAVQLIAQMFSVITLRRSEKVTMGTGDSKLLAMRVRGHGNFTETVPMSLLLLLGAELQGANSILLISLSGVLVVSRWLHAYAFWYDHPKPVHIRYRVAGTVGTINVMAVTTAILLYNNAMQYF